MSADKVGTETVAFATAFSLRFRNRNAPSNCGEHRQCRKCGRGTLYRNRDPLAQGKWCPEEKILWTPK
jgi:hypothetical protein